MARFGLLLVSGLLACSVSLAAILSQIPIAHDAGEPRLAQAAVAPVDDVDQAEPVRERVRHKRNSRQQKRAERERLTVEHQPVNPPPGVADESGGRPESSDNRCDGPESVLLASSDLCSHGPDPAPPGFDVDVPAPLLPTYAAREAGDELACDGDGQSGKRVQLLYVHAADVESRYTEVLPSLRGWAAAANQVFQESAAQTGGTRAIRYVHDTLCQPVVAEVTVSAAGDGSVDRTFGELQARGYARADRIYVAFVDTTSAGICGLGTVWNDDRPGGANAHNFGPGYSRVDAGCWSAWAVAHELMHNLGGVQQSAPNASGGFHCIDEYDIMCYRDGPAAPPMRIDCPDQPLNFTRLDCGHQDYFHTDPPSGSYLATRWNPANSPFLIGASPLPPPVVIPPAATVTSPPSSGVSTGAEQIIDSQDNQSPKKARKHKKHAKKGKGNNGKGKHRRR